MVRLGVPYLAACAALNAVAREIEAERAAERLAELAEIRRTLWPHDKDGVAVPPVFARFMRIDPEAEYEMKCQAEAIRTGRDY
jgi:hypothetical protein